MLFRSREVERRLEGLDRHGHAALAEPRRQVRRAVRLAEDRRDRERPVLARPAADDDDRTARLGLGADEALISMLREALTGREVIEIAWSR